MGDYSVIRNKNGILCYILTNQPDNPPREEVEQIHLMQLIRAHTPYEASLTWHTVNEGMAKAQYRHAMAVAGQLAGVPDVISLWPGSSHPSAAIELKRARRSSSKISSEQVEFISAAEKSGHTFACVAYGAYCGWMAWLDYLSINTPEMRSLAKHLLKR